MDLAEVYLVCNDSLSRELKKISQFKMDLGKSLLDHSRNKQNQQKFVPSDLVIQKQYVYFNRIVNQLGWIGSLGIYTHPSIAYDTIGFYHEDKEVLHTVDKSTSLYDNINVGFGKLFEMIGHKADKDATEGTVEKLHVSSDADEVIYTNNNGVMKKTDKNYKRPEKSFSEMTQEERVAYARNRS